MERIVHDLLPDSPEWHAFRLEHDGASETAAMLGLSKTMTRTDLLHMKATGTPREFSDFVQKRVLDKGKDVEALARPIAAEIIGSTLYPATCSIGRTSASCDGLDMADESAWEHKLINQENAPLVRAGQVPDEHMPQCQQVLMVTGADRLLFMVSDGTRDNMAYVWVEPDTTWFDRIRAGWAQFHKDRGAYMPTEKVIALVAAAVTALPSISVTVEGTIAVKDNFKAFETALRDFIEYRLIRKPESDQDFADLDKQIKALKGAEAALDALESQMLAQVAPIDAAKRTKEMLLTMARDNRLMAEKLLAARKEQIKVEQVQRGKQAVAEHVDTLNARLGRPYMPPVTADFGSAIKGLRTVDSLKNAVDTLLANTKIAASATADLIEINLNTLKELASNQKFLFADTAQLVLKANDDLTALVKNRIAEHQQAEEKRLAAEREQIRAEEQVKAAKEARETLAREADAQRLTDEATARANAATELAAAKAAEPQASVPSPAPVAAPAANVVPMRAAPPTPAVVPATPPTMKLGDLNALLSPISMTADGLTKMGFPPAATDKNAKLYHARDLTHICAALHDLLDQVQAKQAA